MHGCELQAVSNSLQLHSKMLQRGFPAMIDKADLRVPRLTPFTPEFQEAYEASHHSERSPWKSNGYFTSTADMRDYGYEARLHMYSALTREPIHKLEIYETGGKSYAEMRDLVQSIFVCDAERLGTMRVDLCADIYGVDVGWFKRHMTVKGKRLHREFGETSPYQTIQNGHAQTLYAGCKPNQFRVYNKALERLVRWKSYVKRLARDFPEEVPIPYAAMYGHAESDTITRIERQIVARDLQRCDLATFASLKNATAFNPFTPVQILPQCNAPQPEAYPFATWCAGMYLQDQIRTTGLASTLAEMRKWTGRNFYREQKRFAPFLGVPENGTCLDASGLFNAYRNTLERQLGSALGAA
jgi:hypothetical protein